MAEHGGGGVGAWRRGERPAAEQPLSMPPLLPLRSLSDARAVPLRLLSDLLIENEFQYQQRGTQIVPPTGKVWHESCTENNADFS